MYAVARTIFESPVWLQRLLAVVAIVVSIAAILGAGLFGYSIVKAFELIYPR